MKKSHLRPRITHVMDTDTISSLERKIENATEGLSSNCFNFITKYYLQTRKSLWSYVIISPL